MVLLGTAVGRLGVLLAAIACVHQEAVQKCVAAVTMH